MPVACPGPMNPQNCLLNREFLREYCHWQAVKFSIVDRAYEQICGPVRLEKPEPRLGAVREA